PKQPRRPTNERLPQRVPRRLRPPTPRQSAPPGTTRARTGTRNRVGRRTAGREALSARGGPAHRPARYGLRTVPRRGRPAHQGGPMIIAQIVDATRYPDGMTCSTTCALTSDVGYSTEVTEDLARRVIAMRDTDQTSEIDAEEDQ